MIDSTPNQSIAYDRMLVDERSAEHNAAINRKADELLRGFECEDVEYALTDHLEQLRDMVIANDLTGAGLIVSNALRDHADRIARRLAE